MKAISIYQRREFFYVCPYAHTEQGVSILTGPCIKLPVVGTTATELGEGALRALEQADVVIPHPEDWSKLPPSPILATAGVKNWTAFSKGTLSIELERLEVELLLTPTRQYGRDGFAPLDEHEVHLPTTATATELGEAIQQALALCR